MDIKPVIYTGKEFKPLVTIKNGTVILLKGRDYDIVRYEDNVDAGTGKVIITGKGNYKGTEIVKEFTITPKAIPNAILTVAYGSVNVGTPQEPEVTVKVGTVIMKKDVDYTVSYKNNINAGTAIARIDFINNYSGTKQANFYIIERVLMDFSGDFSTLAIDSKYIHNINKIIEQKIWPVDQMGNKLINPSVTTTYTDNNNSYNPTISNPNTITVTATQNSIVKVAKIDYYIVAIG